MPQSYPLVYLGLGISITIELILLLILFIFFAIITAWSSFALAIGSWWKNLFSFLLYSRTLQWPPPSLSVFTFLLYFIKKLVFSWFFIVPSSMFLQVLSWPSGTLQSSPCNINSETVGPTMPILLLSIPISF